MGNRISIFLVCILGQLCFGQISDRKPLHGRVVNDSISLGNGFVHNLNSNAKIFISSEGLFDLLAKVNDTLLFSGQAFQSKKIILTRKDFDSKILIVKLNVVTNHLKEVVIRKKTTPSFGNTQRIVDKKYFDDAQSSPKNRLMPSDGTIENGVDFTRLFKDIFKLISGKKPEKTALELEVNFIEVVNEKFKSSFFINTLKINEYQIGLFLIFCENDPKSRIALNSEFELMDFLITKSEEFKTNITLKK